MGQVPHYGIVGDGRVARHLSEYFRLEGIPFQTWSRRHDPRPAGEALALARIVLLAIGDSAIEGFVRENPFLRERTAVHFSGALVTELASGAHPLFTFGPTLYGLETYRRIPFVCEEGVTLAGIFPGLRNPCFTLKRELKPLYHGLCVMSGNFTTLLWQKFFSELEGRLGIPREAALPYLERIAANLRENAEGALSGPLQRRDLGTIRTNLAALSGDDYEPVYRAFVGAAGLSGAIQ